jgi:hypothetical protein
MREKIRSDRILVGKPEVKDYLRDLGVDGMIILKSILNKLCEDVEWNHLDLNTDK